MNLIDKPFASCCCRHP